MALPAVMPAPPQSAAAIQFTSNDQLDKMRSAADDLQAKSVAQSTEVDPRFSSNLIGYVRKSYDEMRRHRDSAAGWSRRMLAALRAFDGQYDPTHLSEIQKFNGTTAYLRVVAMKCRAASSLLRDVYLNADRPWGLQPPADPDVPLEALQALKTKVQIEVQDQEQSTQQPLSDEEVRDRTMGLYEALKDGIKRKLREKSEIAEDKIDDILNQGGFYRSLAEFLVDLPLYPFACVKGPEVRIYPTVTWTGNKPTMVNKPRLIWNRVSPFDIWFTPGVADIEDADVIERVRYTRADLNVLLDLPGYDHDAVRNVLTNYGSAGFNDDWESTDSQRAALESRENPLWNVSRLITGFKYSGNVQGLLLLQQGVDPSLIDDPIRDYTVEIWCVGQYVLKVQLAPSVRRRHNYYITSFEKVPGTPVGNALPDILGDLQNASNATFRAIINNQAMASGPQVVVKDDRLSGAETGDDMYPWKRWHVNSDPFASGSSTDKPIDFWQPTDNSQALLTVLQTWLTLGDDVSAIPRYLQGNSPGGGAGRTASGLAMLMGNASKILQTVAANIDREVLDPLLHYLLDMILMTDTTDTLDGTEKVVVKGVAVAMQRETQRSRQLEFLQVTNNPYDMQIIGPKGRANVLRAVTKELGLPGDEIVPTDDQLNKQQQMAQENAAMGGIPGHQSQPNEDQGQGGGDGQPGVDGGGPGGGGMSSPQAGGGGQGGGGQGGGGQAPVQKSSLQAGPRANMMGRQRIVRSQNG